MHKKILIIGSERSEYLSDLEKRVFGFGFETLFVLSSFQGLEKLEQELYSIIIYDIKCRELDRLDFLKKLSQNPFAAVTPLIVIRDARENTELPRLSSVLDQTFTTETSASFVAEYVQETEDLRKKKVKKGSLAAIPVTRILFDAYNFKFSGAVIFERLSEKKIIYFDQGHVIFASSNNPNERFGEFMISQGMLTKEQLEGVLEISQKSSLRFGQILVEMGFIREETLEPLIHGQIKQILFSIFDWEIGDYYLLAEETSTMNEIPARFQTSVLIFEGIKRKHNTTKLIRLLSPLNRPAIVNKKWELFGKDFGLTRTETTFVEGISDGTTIEKVLKDSKLSELESLRVIFLLYSTNFLKISDESETIVGEVVSKASPIAKTLNIDKDKLKEAVIIHEVGKKKREEPLKGTEPAKPTRIRSSDKPGMAKTSLLWKLLGTAGMLFIVFLVVVYVYINSSFMSQYPSETYSDIRLVKKTPFVIKTPHNGRQTESPPDKTVPAARETAKAQTPKPTAAMTAKAQPAAAPQKEAGAQPPPIRTKAQPQSGAVFEGHLRMGRKYLEDGEPGKAMSEYRKAFAINPNSDKLLVEMGRVYFEEDSSVEAIEKFKQALRINPRNADARLYLGNVYQFHGKSKLAIEEYRIYLRLQPGSPHSEEVRRILKMLEEQ